MAFVVNRLESLKYDGTNGSFIVGDWLADCELESDDGSLLKFRHNTTDLYEVPLNEWVLRGGAQNFVGTCADDAYQIRYIELP